jgi:hypothetical protein
MVPQHGGGAGLQREFPRAKLPPAKDLQKCDAKAFWEIRIYGPESRVGAHSSLKKRPRQARARGTGGRPSASAIFD